MIAPVPPPIIEIRQPPSFCQYAGGPCDQDFTSLSPSRALFLYPSEPKNISSTIEGAVRLLRLREPTISWLTWREFRPVGQVIFCTICQRMRFSDTAFLDVTTLNFNLMFEIGFALGLGLRLGLLRDTTYQANKREFKELGILENIGYIDFQNSEGLSEALLQVLPSLRPIPIPPVELNREQPVYVVKSHISNDGQMRLLSVIKNSPLRFRTYDPIEDPPLSVQDARKQVSSSFGVVGHLLDPSRVGSSVHNSRTALIAGLGVSLGKTVVLLQEGPAPQPIDYRDLVIPYTDAGQIEGRLASFVQQTLQHRLDTSVVASRPPQGLLEKLDLGDPAAENEIGQLKQYFIPTAQYNEARRGHARLIVGRKGAGKTAIFYGVRDSLPKTPAYLVLDLKPEGHQFTKLREVVLDRMTLGLREHTLTAFWQYLLLCEIVQKVVDTDYSFAAREPERYSEFEALRTDYRQRMPDDTGDMSERLLRQVNLLASRAVPEDPGAVTAELFSRDIPTLERLVSAYLRHKKEVWLLFDNIDKGWPTLTATAGDVLIVRTLLEAARKLQKQLDQRDVDFYCLVFLRNDIYDLLVKNTPDRDKDTAVTVDWDDAEGFKEFVRQRIVTSTDLSGPFDEVWSAAFEQHINTQDAFRYVVERTLMRPRDLLRFLRRAVDVAVNRGNSRVQAEDFVMAETTYSEDLLMSINYEIGDVRQEYLDLLYHFIGDAWAMSRDDVIEKLRDVVGDDHAEDALRLLLWFGFLGVGEGRQEGALYSYQVRYNLGKLLAVLGRPAGVIIIHPAFRKALGTATPASRLPF